MSESLVVGTSNAWWHGSVGSPLWSEHQTLGGMAQSVGLPAILASQKEPVGIYFISEDLFTLASYYHRDLFETDFLPEGMNILPDTESDHLLPGGLEVASDDE